MANKVVLEPVLNIFKKKRFRFRGLAGGVSVPLKYDVDRKDVVVIEIHAAQKYKNHGQESRSEQMECHNIKEHRNW